MMKGTIARVTDRGFGFITPENGEKDIFFHANELNGLSFDELREGDAVTFEIANGPKGPAATNVMRATAQAQDLPAAA
ncbi:cold shock domain-containing protein [Candidatus Kaiserbacteria bacterium]|nr:cold shock domain-containing protein [Candidatus Kaiserbacteria bacterium]